MKSQSKQEKILDLFKPLIDKAIKEGKMIIDIRDDMTYLPHYFKNLIISNSILSPEEHELKFFQTYERKDNGLQITSIILDDAISNINTLKKEKEQIFEQIINQTTRMETIVKVRDLNAGKNKITTPRGMPKLNIGLRDVTISKEGMAKFNKTDDFYFKISIFEIQGKQILCMTDIEKDNSQGMFRKTKKGSKFICHRIVLTDDIRDFYQVKKTEKFVLSIGEEIEFEGKSYFKLEKID